MASFVGVLLNVRRPILKVSGLLVRINVPHNVVRETNDLLSSTLGHLCESLSLGLVLESVRREVDAWDSVST